MDVAAIMPCRGRTEQTIENVRRLLATAGLERWQFWLVGGGVDTDVIWQISQAIDPKCGRVWRVLGKEPLTYWQALRDATSSTTAPLLINLANDLWACDDWLKIAVEEYRARFGDGLGLLGFAGDGHPPQHSCHFLISRELLERYDGWPIWYAHNFGDTELCLRAQQDGLYTKSERAWLEHCHPMLGQGQDDEVYRAGRATFQRDQALFEQRRRVGWPTVHSK